MRSLLLALLLALSLVAVLAEARTHTVVSKEDRDITKNELSVIPKLIEDVKRNKRSLSTSMVDMWDALPPFKGIIGSRTPVQWEDDTFAYTATASSQGSTITVNFSLKRKKFGEENYVFLSLKGMHLHAFILDGEHTIEYTDMDADEIEEFNLVGFKAYKFNGVFDSLESLTELMLFFIAAKDNQVIYHFTNADNLAFLKQYMGMTPVTRVGAPNLTMTRDEAQWGDMLTGWALDGLEPFMMWGSGGRGGHVGIVWECNNQKLICDSTRRGVICYDYDDWVALNIKEQFNIVLMPLDPALRSTMDKEAGCAYIQKVNGLPYGNQNFLLGILDTLDASTPSPIQPQHMELFGALTYKFYQSENHIEMVEALTKRLGLDENTTTWPQAVLEAEKQYGSLLGALIVPEQDEWLYEGHIARVCSAFGVDMVKQAGGFGNLIVQTTEFTPKDVIDIQLYDKNFAARAPQACKDADPEMVARGYCQLLGQYKVYLQDTYNSVPPYNHMFEHCPTFSRPAGCQISPF